VEGQASPRSRYVQHAKKHPLCKLTLPVDSHIYYVSGCSIGTDTINFLRNGACLTAIDISRESVKIAQSRAKVDGYDDANIFEANVEKLDQYAPFQDPANVPFDLIYSFGVIHHTPDPRAAIEQLSKLQEHGGELRLMLYSKISYKLMWAMHEQNRWKVSEADDVIREYAEAQSGCPVAFTYTFEEVKQLLSPWYEVNTIEKDHIFRWDVEKYIKKEYELDDTWKGVSDDVVKAWEKELGWHTLIKAVRK